ncbi:hypothetical protein B1748_32475 [Paenibacillus sp. MY03]|jgi:uncharacterized protein (DUF58 family)|uniref:DUF58 domain-containing protein n=1 Tax=Paenibacillus sp. MY03 TaxID=302980 RepID=UPI000B3BEAC3|nr:DUF58 domain-containing protein [Paenibacillus sp. MY03]OUS69029.1 hypothetical protein B1748_32475 [Paenibacillus sp. MY03]
MTSTKELQQIKGGDEAFSYLFPESGLLAKLERMSLAGGSRVQGTLAGKRRSTSLGGSQEFADYRPYAPGDDIRRIDWNVYGRTGKPFIRQYWDEQELHATLYIDTSVSMSNFGGVEANKLTCALRLAAAVGYAALCGGDRLSVRTFAGQGMDEGVRLAGGRASSLHLFRYLADQKPSNPAADLPSKRSEATAAGIGISDQKPAKSASPHSINPPETREADASISDLSRPFRQPGRLPRRAGVSWVFTDGWYESGIAETLLALAAAGQHVVFVQLLSPQELDPRLDGELRLIDAELGTGKEVALSGGLLRQYRQTLAEFQDELRRQCADRGIPFVFIDTSRSISDIIASLATIPNTLRL